MHNQKIMLIFVSQTNTNTMSREEFIQKLQAEVERQMQLRMAIAKLTLIADRTQKNAFSVLSSNRFEMKVANN